MLPGFIGWRRLRRGSLPLPGSLVNPPLNADGLPRRKKIRHGHAGFFEDWWA